MSYTIGLTHPDSVKGVLAISGRILPEINPVIDAQHPALQHLKIYIGHGVLDNALNITYAREAKKYLSKLGIHPEYKEYETGHQITMEMLEDFTRWLNEWVVLLNGIPKNNLLKTPTINKWAGSWLSP